MAPAAVIFEGVGWLPVPDDTPRAVAYDPALPYTDRAAQFNRGCPHGYAAVFFGQDAACRLLDEEYVNDPSIREREAELSWFDWTTQVVGGALLSPSTYADMRAFFSWELGQVAELVPYVARKVVAPAVRATVTAVWPVLALAAGGLVLWGWAKGR